MNVQREMDTMTAVLQTLHDQKWDNEFLLTDNGLVSIKGRRYAQKEIKIMKTYRFEGESDPADQAIIYVVEASDGTKGYSIDAYGVYTNKTERYRDLISKMASM